MTSPDDLLLNTAIGVGVFMVLLVVSALISILLDGWE